MGATGAEFGRTSETSLKKTFDGSMCLVVIVVVIFYLCGNYNSLSV